MGLLRRAPRSTLDQITAALEQFELPSFPQVAAEALQKLADPNIAMREIAEVLERDPGLSVHFLRLANSATLGLRSTVDSLDRAVAMLGRNQVESILIGRAVADSLTSRSPVIEAPRFWGTAAMRAVVASQLALLIDPSHRSEHFTAGLLQDMALLVLSENVDGYCEVLGNWYGGSVVDLCAAEVERFGWDHTAVGAVMCRKWNFPEKLIDAVESHHDHDDPPSPSQLVGDWHETDLERGPATLEALAADLQETSGRIEALLEASAQQAAELSGVFG
ncbi:MAG: HDOD domain-containing protein [Acidimicrobiales bacterium]